MIEKFFQLFVNRDDVYYRHGGGCVREPVTTELISRHLKGELTVCLPPFDQLGNCKWAAWDSDTNDGCLLRVKTLLIRTGFNPLVEGRRFDRIKNLERQGHLWLALNEPLPAPLLRAFDRAIRNRLNISKESLEFIPKQDSASVGSSLRMPLGINRKPEVMERSWFDGVQPDIDAQLKWLLSQPLNSAQRIKEIAMSFLAAEEQQRRDLSLLKPIPKAGRQVSFQRTPILQLVDSRRVGREFWAQCPLCALENHDTHKDNLRISADGSRWCCVYGGPGAIHSAREIIRQLTGENYVSTY